jgi:hypothetical protein
VVQRVQYERKEATLLHGTSVVIDSTHPQSIGTVVQDMHPVFNTSPQSYHNAVRTGLLNIEDEFDKIMALHKGILFLDALQCERLSQINERDIVFWNVRKR